MKISGQRDAWRRLEDGAAGRFLRRKAVWPILAMALISAGGWWAYAQRELPRKESKFTFARVQFSYPPSFHWRGGIGDPNGPPWSHDFPRSEENLMKIMSEVTKVDVNPGGHIFTFQTDDCFKYPIAYLCEVGYITLSDQEAHNMREYLLRGGFLIVDDFRGSREMYNFIDEMRIVFPDRALEELPHDHPIFTCFYDLRNIYIEPPYQRNQRPAYYGMYDDNKRLMMVVDYNNDVSEYWEWSADPFYKIEDTNEAFKYGVNYIMYALTH
ncbi:MAG: DUF4159 domain-containing protein [Acidobacteriia bacterium]|nr:DUF4159 domain-containing protein [Terriglobia bacterium]